MSVGPTRVRRSISCTPSEWSRIRTLAAEAGLSETDYLMRRALDDDPATAPATGLNATQQAALAADLAWLCERLTRPLQDSAVTAAEAVGFLAADRYALQGQTTQGDGDK